MLEFVKFLKGEKEFFKIDNIKYLLKEFETKFNSGLKILNYEILADYPISRLGDFKYLKLCFEDGRDGDYYNMTRITY